MNVRELKLKNISNEFAKWQIQLENLNSLNLFDANIISEFTLCEILNRIFDYNLTNVILFSKNFPAVDLVDNDNRIAIQVTSTFKKTKIKYTLDNFFTKKLDLKYDKLLIIILGKRQKSYTNLKLPMDYSFNESEHILDFKSLLNIISRLPLKKIESISTLLANESILHSKMPRNPNISKVKKKLSLKKKLQKDLLREIDRIHWDYLGYEPWIKFRYSSVIIRSIDDSSWPNLVENEKENMSSWFKGEFWDFYENGIEFISYGGDAIFDINGNWDLLKMGIDSGVIGKEYKVVPYDTFLRIPFEFIVDYDMEPDKYHGLPAIYVEYAKDGMPFEEILYGKGGHYVKSNPKESYRTNYFDMTKRRKLL